MKYINLLTMATFLILLTACQESEPLAQEASGANSQKDISSDLEDFPSNYVEGAHFYTQIFIDLTDSSIYNKTAKKEMADMIRERLVHPDDQVDILFLTANTATNPVSPIELILEIPAREYSEHSNLKQRTFDRKYAKARSSALDQLLSKAISEIDNRPIAHQSNSDILAFLKLSHQQLEGKSFSDAQLYLLSDMEHYVDFYKGKGGYFETDTRFCSRDCQSLSHQGDAQKDGQIIKSRLGSIDIFKQMSIITNGGGKQSPDRNHRVLNAMAKYWEQLLKTELGFKNYKKK